MLATWQVWFGVVFLAQVLFVLGIIWLIRLVTKRRVAQAEAALLKRGVELGQELFHSLKGEIRRKCWPLWIEPNRRQVGIYTVRIEGGANVNRHNMLTVDFLPSGLIAVTYALGRTPDMYDATTVGKEAAYNEILHYLRVQMFLDPRTSHLVH